MKSVEIKPNKADNVVSQLVNPDQGGLQDCIPLHIPLTRICPGTQSEHTPFTRTFLPLHPQQSGGWKEPLQLVQPRSTLQCSAKALNVQIAAMQEEFIQEISIIFLHC